MKLLLVALTVMAIAGCAVEPLPLAHLHHEHESRPVFFHRGYR